MEPDLEYRPNSLNSVRAQHDTPVISDLECRLNSLNSVRAQQDTPVISDLFKVNQKFQQMTILKSKINLSLKYNSVENYLLKDVDLLDKCVYRQQEVLRFYRNSKKSWKFKILKSPECLNFKTLVTSVF